MSITNQVEPLPKVGSIMFEFCYNRNYVEIISINSIDYNKGHNVTVSSICSNKFTPYIRPTKRRVCSKYLRKISIPELEKAKKGIIRSAICCQEIIERIQKEDSTS